MVIAFALVASTLLAPPPLSDHGCHAATRTGDAVYCINHYRYGEATAEVMLIRLSGRPDAHRVRASRTLLYEGPAALSPGAKAKVQKALGGLKTPLVPDGLVRLEPTVKEKKRRAWTSPDGKSHLEMHDRWAVMEAVAFRSGAQESVAKVRLAGDPDAPWSVGAVWWVSGSRTWIIQVIWKPERPDPEFQLETGVFFLRAPDEQP